MRGLVDPNDRPTDALRALAQNFDTDTWPETLADVLKKSYPSLFALDLHSVSPAQLAEAIKPMAGSDEVRRKCYVFFVQAAQSAAIPISKRVMDQMKRGASGAPQRKRAQRDARPRSNGDTAKTRAPSGEVDNKSSPPPPLRQPSDILNRLLDKFPQFDPKWPEEIKAQWFAGFDRLMGAMGTSKS